MPFLQPLALRLELLIYLFVLIRLPLFNIWGVFRASRESGIGVNGVPRDTGLSVALIASFLLLQHLVSFAMVLLCAVLQLANRRTHGNSFRRFDFILSRFSDACSRTGPSGSLCSHYKFGEEE